MVWREEERTQMTTGKIEREGGDTKRGEVVVGAHRGKRSERGKARANQRRRQKP